MLEGKHGGQPVLNGKLCKLGATFGEGWTRQHHHQLRPTRGRRLECSSEIVRWNFKLQRLDLEIERLCGLIGRSELVDGQWVVEYSQPVAVRKRLPQKVNLLSGPEMLPAGSCQLAVHEQLPATPVPR